MLKHKPLWQLNEEESELAHKVVDWVTFDQGTKGSGSDAQSAPKFATPVYRSYVIRRVKMAEIEVYDKTYRLGSDIPPQFVDHVEFPQTPREREIYQVIADKYLKQASVLTQPKEKTTQAMAGDDFLSKVKASTPNDDEILSETEAKKNIVKIRGSLIAQNSSPCGVLKLRHLNDANVFYRTLTPFVLPRPTPSSHYHPHTTIITPPSSHYHRHTTVLALPYSNTTSLHDNYQTNNPAAAIDTPALWCPKIQEIIAHHRRVHFRAPYLEAVPELTIHDVPEREHSEPSVSATSPEGGYESPSDPGSSIQTRNSISLYSVAFGEYENEGRIKRTIGETAAKEVKTLIRYLQRKIGDRITATESRDMYNFLSFKIQMHDVGILIFNIALVQRFLEAPVIGEAQVQGTERTIAQELLAKRQDFVARVVNSLDQVAKDQNKLAEAAKPADRPLQATIATIVASHMAELKNKITTPPASDVQYRVDGPNIKRVFALKPDVGKNAFLREIWNDAKWIWYWEVRELVDIQKMTTTEPMATYAFHEFAHCAKEQYNSIIAVDLHNHYKKMDRNPYLSSLKDLTKDAKSYCTFCYRFESDYRFLCNTPGSAHYGPQYKVDNLSGIYVFEGARNYKTDGYKARETRAMYNSFEMALRHTTGVHHVRGEESDEE